MAITRYTVKLGDRWDSIAYKAYGDVGNITIEDRTISKIQYLIEANPTLPIAYDLVAGTILNIPIIDVVQNTSDSLLPPWKRSSNQL
jgi:phage tail protein X